MFVALCQGITDRHTRSFHVVHTEVFSSKRGRKDSKFKENFKDCISSFVSSGPYACVKSSAASNS